MCDLQVFPLIYMIVISCPRLFAVIVMFVSVIT